MALALSGTSNGSLNNLSLSGNTATIVDTARAGGIIQVVQATTTTTVPVSTTNYTDTGLTGSITPTSSSNKIFVFITQNTRMARNSSPVGAGIKIFRDSTEIYTPTADGNGPLTQYFDSTNVINQVSLQILDSPATTSSVTYKTEGRPYLSSQGGQVNFNYGSSSPSTITLIEVVA